MSHQQTIAEIQNAIRAHGAWKIRLKDPIAKRSSAVTPEFVACDDKCDFGKWLYGPNIPDDLCAGAAFQNIKQMHGEFHKCASGVLAKALAGDGAGAAQDLDGEFAARSSKLVVALTRWRTELGG